MEVNRKTYLMTDGKYIKIGLSRSPVKRMASLERYMDVISPVDVDKYNLQLVYIILGNIEIDLHKKYKSKNIIGEWFKLSDIDINEIKNDYNTTKIYLSNYY